MTSMPRIRPKQLVLPPPPETSAEDAQAYFERRLAFETDPADVYHDRSSGVADFVLVDARSSQAHQECRIPGAVSLPQGRIRASTTADLDPDVLLVTYCWGPGCNGATKAAARLSALGFRVREMIGGLEYWRREGYPVEGTRADSTSLTGGLS